MYSVEYEKIIWVLPQQCTMVHLTITTAILRAIEELQDRKQFPEELSEASEPSLDKPILGNPITHGQIISISHTLRKIRSQSTNGVVNTDVSYHLDDLLRGSKVYVDPPKPKAEPVGTTDFASQDAVSLICGRLQSTKP